MTYSRVLIGTDLSEEAAEAAELAVRLSTPRTKFRVCFVRPDPWPPAKGPHPRSPSSDVREVVEGWAARAGVPRAEIGLPVGSAPRQLVRDAETWGADLIVLGHKGQARAPRPLLGSTVRAVLRAGTADTLVARSAALLPREPILQSILVATDFHGPSEVAAHRALQLAKQVESDLTVAHVVDPTLWYDPGFEPPLEANGGLERELQGRLSAFNEEHLQGRATEVILHGRPPLELSRHAGRSNTQLLVIGNHGSGVLERAMIGSTAETIVELAPCSVLVVRSGGA